MQRSDLQFLRQSSLLPAGILMEVLFTECIPEALSTHVRVPEARWRISNVYHEHEWQTSEGGCFGKRKAVVSQPRSRMAQWQLFPIIVFVPPPTMTLCLIERVSPTAKVSLKGPGL